MEKNEEKNKTYVIIGLLIAVVIMTIAYMRLATVARLKTNTYAEDDVWDIAITNIKMVESRGSASEKTKPTFSSRNASFDVHLEKPNDYMKYEVTIKNRGTLNAKLHSYLIIPEIDTPNIEYTIDNLYVNQSLLSGNETKMYVTIKYIGETDKPQESSKTIILEYLQK